MRKRLLSVLLVLAMVLGTMPLYAFAADTNVDDEYAQEEAIVDTEGDQSVTNEDLSTDSILNDESAIDDDFCDPDNEMVEEPSDEDVSDDDFFYNYMPMLGAAPGGAPAPIDVAEIGSVKYQSLADAAAASKEKDVIILLADLSDSISLKKGVVLNCNGMNYSGKVTTSVSGGEVVSYTDAKGNKCYKVCTKPVLTYRTHVQKDGWQDYVSEGKMSGTQGRSLRLEGINIKLDDNNYDGTIEYRTHIQKIGWESTWRKNNQFSGTQGKSLRLEAIQIRLTGELEKAYDVYYRVHSQQIGWMGWAKNGEKAGTAGYSYRLEGIEIRLVKKGGAAPGSTAKAFQGVVSGIQYRTHVQKVGWQKFVKDGEMSGTQGRSLRLEGIEIKLDPSIEGGVEYRTHIQTYGWESKYKANGEMSGTQGESKRLEAIQIRLTGDAAKKYDVYYRVHCQSVGWLGWAKNGEMSGTAGKSKRLEGIEIKLIIKGSKAPSSSAPAYFNCNTGSGRAAFNCQTVYLNHGKDAKSLYNWCVNNITYVNVGRTPPKGYTNTEYLSAFGFEKHYGDCRVFASTFHQLAKNAGYKTKYCYGFVPSRGGNMVPHAWVEIYINGATYVCDPDFQYETGYNGYLIRYGQHMTWRYANWHYED